MLLELFKPIWDNNQAPWQMKATQAAMHYLLRSVTTYMLHAERTYKLMND